MKPFGVQFWVVFYSSDWRIQEYKIPPYANFSRQVPPFKKGGDAKVMNFFADEVYNKASRV